jgi:uncharacterized protein YkwD
MKIKSSLKVMVTFVVAVLASCTSLPETQKHTASGISRPDSSLSGQVYAAVNSYRQSHGVAELERHAGLDRLAQAHCEYLRKNRGKFGIYGKNVSHYGSEGRALVARERYHMLNSSENVASIDRCGKNVAPALVNLWTNSKDHEKNLLSSWTHTGVGVVVDNDGTVFSTEIFAIFSNSQMTNHQRFSGF